MVQGADGFERRRERPEFGMDRTETVTPGDDDPAQIPHRVVDDIEVRVWIVEQDLDRPRQGIALPTAVVDQEMLHKLLLYHDPASSLMWSSSKLIAGAHIF